MTRAALALIERQGRWFLQRRDTANPEFPGLWEFPGGKLEPNESPEAALRRELHEEVGLSLVEAQPLPAVTGAVSLYPFLVRVAGAPRTELAWGWFTPEEVRRLPLPPANTALLDVLSRSTEARPD